MDSFLQEIVFIDYKHIAVYIIYCLVLIILFISIILVNFELLKH